MAKWKLVGREYIGANNITRVTITEDINWQRIVVNIAGDLSGENTEEVVDRAISEFIKRERPEFAQQFVDQELVTLKEELEASKKTIAEHQEEIDVTKGRLTATQEEVSNVQLEMETSKEDITNTQSELSSTKEEVKGTKEALGRTQEDLSDTLVDLVVTQVGLAETKHVLESTKKEFTQTKKYVEDMKKQVDTLVVSFSNLTKEQEEALADKYDPWEVGLSYSVGDKVHYESVNYEVLQEHTSQGDWLPGGTPSLYKVIKNDDIETEEGAVEVIDEFEASSTNPYGIGDKVAFQGKVYESTIDNNVWSPTDYPRGWKEVTE